MTESEQLTASRREIHDINSALDAHAIVAITDPQGRITYVNDKFCVISEYSRAELLGQNHRILNSGHHSAEYMRDLWSTISHGRVWQGEIKNKTKSGTNYWVATTIAPILNEEGKPSQYISIRTDITRRKQAEEDVKKLNAELEQRVAGRTAELEAFTYSASHDLRGPLHSIEGYAQLMLEDFGMTGPDEERRRLKAIIAAATRMEALMEDLLVFARANRQSLKKERVDTDRLVSATWAELCRPDLAPAVQIHIGALPDCYADPSLLKQIWVNLLSNALKYSSRREHAVIEVGCRAIAGVDCFFVRDNGVGFDMRNAEKLFEPFERLHRSADFTGTGVGLAIVRRIAIRHGGRVWAEATVDQGATFYFTVANNSVAEERGPSMSSSPMPTSGAHSAAAIDSSRPSVH